MGHQAHLLRGARGQGKTPWGALLSLKTVPLWVLSSRELLGRTGDLPGAEGSPSTAPLLFHLMRTDHGFKKKLLFKAKEVA